MGTWAFVKGIPLILQVAQEPPADFGGRLAIGALPVKTGHHVQLTHRNCLDPGQGAAPPGRYSHDRGTATQRLVRPLTGDLACYGFELARSPVMLSRGDQGKVCRWHTVHLWAKAIQACQGSALSAALPLGTGEYLLTQAQMTLSSVGQRADWNYVWTLNVVEIFEPANSYRTPEHALRTFGAQPVQLALPQFPTAFAVDLLRPASLESTNPAKQNARRAQPQSFRRCNSRC